MRVSHPVHQATKLAKVNKMCKSTSARSLADNFISPHIEKYGLNGTNTQKNPSQGWPSFNHNPLPQLSKNNHFQFGYNGDAFNWRESSTCMFWTQYGNVSSKVLPFREELFLSVNELPTYNGVSISFLGSEISFFLSQLILLSTQRPIITLPRCLDKTGLDFEGQLMSSQLAKTHPNLDSQFEFIDFQWSEFEEFLEKISRQVRCADPYLAFSIFIGSKSQSLHIYEGYWPKICDQNYDKSANSAVGPAYWCLEDYEGETSVAKFLIANNLRGVPDIIRYRPEILASIFLSSTFKSWISETSTENRGAESGLLFTKLLTEELNFHVQKFSVFDDLKSLLSTYESALIKNNPKSNEVWLTPLHRLMDHLNVDSSYLNIEAKEIYGKVLQ